MKRLCPKLARPRKPAEQEGLGRLRLGVGVGLGKARLAPPLLHLLLRHLKPEGLQMGQAIQALPQIQSHLAAEAPLPQVLQARYMHLPPW